ncbi:MAG: hypothetical protein N2645_06575 [Clostridia bacterium]|nr:hypothetical protein [Clostridia bacterium]
MNKDQLPPQVRKIIDEVNKLEGEYKFQLSHSEILGEKTIGNTSSCTNIGGCKPDNCAACD